MKITQKRLNEIITSHSKWLLGEDGGERADLSNANLCGSNLSGIDLRGANLHGANLCDADLCDADLSGSNLRGVNLSNANLHGANLYGANPCDANLHGVSLNDVNLSGANLCSATLDQTYYQITRIGSRNGTTIYCVENDNIVCGCWNHYKGGTLADFKERVKNIYGEYGEIPNEKYYRQYMAAIEFFEKMAELGKE